MKLSDQKIGLIISCRYSSKRLPGKALLKFGDITAIGLLIRRLKKSELVKKIVLATSFNQEDDVLINEAKISGILSHRGELDNVLNRNLEAAIENDLDYIIRVTGDCPFIDGKFVDNCLVQLTDYNNSIHTTKGNFPKGLDIEIVPRSFLEKIDIIPNLNKKYKEHMLSFFYENHKNDKIKYFTNQYGINVNETFTMDSEEDYIKLKKMYEYFNNPYFSVPELLNFVNQNEL